MCYQRARNPLYNAGKPQSHNVSISDGPRSVSWVRHFRTQLDEDAKLFRQLSMQGFHRRLTGVDFPARKLPSARKSRGCYSSCSE